MNNGRSKENTNSNLVTFGQMRPLQIKLGKKKKTGITVKGVLNLFQIISIRIPITDT